MIKQLVAFACFAALGSCYKQGFENPNQQSLSETVKVVWSSDAEVQITNKKDIWLFGERVTVEYKLNTDTWRKESGVEVSLIYPARQFDPRYVHVIDVDNDGKADQVWTSTPPVDIKRDNNKANRIFHHADLVLAKLRKELRVDEVFSLGPNGLLDPFVQEHD